MNETGQALKLNLVLMLGAEAGSELSPVVAAMNEFLRLAANATLHNALASGKFFRLLVLTNDRLFEPPAGVARYSDPTGEFHFGQSLRAAIANLPEDEAVVYLGAGAGLLFGRAEWDGLEAALRSSSPVVTANNYFSADLVGWQPTRALFNLPVSDLPDSDNNLAWVLCRRGGLRWQPMLPGNGRSLATQYDIDTPTDVAALALWLHQNRLTASHLALVSRYLESCPAFEAIPTQPILAALGNFESEILVTGRLSAGLHRTLELRTHGQVRLLSEERGMRASGRDERGEVQSLAGFLLEELGPKKFFEKLAKSADAAIVDSRVLFAHLKRRPSRADRFNSDAFRPDQIQDPVVRAFSEAALEARERWNFPVLLGGHSVVAGSLLLLLELVPTKDY